MLLRLFLLAQWFGCEWREEKLVLKKAPPTKFDLLLLVLVGGMLGACAGGPLGPFVLAFTHIPEKGLEGMLLGAVLGAITGIAILGLNRWHGR
jgi:hypothetical protein